MKFPWTKGKYDTLQCHNKKYMYMYILAWKLRSLISRWLARRMFPVDLFCFTLPMNIHRLALSALILTWMFWKFLNMDIAVWPFFHPLNVWFSCWKVFSSLKDILRWVNLYSYVVLYSMLSVHHNGFYKDISSRIHYAL